MRNLGIVGPTVAESRAPKVGKSLAVEIFFICSCWAELLLAKRLGVTVDAAVACGDAS